MKSNVELAGSVSSKDRIDELCDEFEATWLQGDRPRIADFIERVASDEQAILFYELLLVELEYRRNRGERPSRDRYVRAFPQFADTIESVNFHCEKAFATLSPLPAHRAPAPR